MKIKAVIPFAGVVTMAPGEIKDVPDKMAAEFIAVGYAEPVDEFSDKMNPPTIEAVEEGEPVKKKRATKKKEIFNED